MANILTKKLYQNLIDSKFNFVSRGRHRITEIYDCVHLRYPDLCDDNYLCIENCQKGVNQPEWKHIVRGALDALKESSQQIKKDSKKGFWVFV